MEVQYGITCSNSIERKKSVVCTRVYPKTIKSHVVIHWLY